MATFDPDTARETPRGFSIGGTLLDEEDTDKLEDINPREVDLNLRTCSNPSEGQVFCMSLYLKTTPPLEQRNPEYLYNDPEEYYHPIDEKMKRSKFDNGEITKQIVTLIEKSDVYKFKIAGTDAYVTFNSSTLEEYSIRLIHDEELIPMFDLKGEFTAYKL